MRSVNSRLVVVVAYLKLNNDFCSYHTSCSKISCNTRASESIIWVVRFATSTVFARIYIAFRWLEKKL